VSLQETARLTANGLSRIYKLIPAGELEAYQDGRARRVVMESIVAYVARRRAASAKKRQQLNSRPPRRQQAANSKVAASPKRRARVEQPELPAE
jgi:excisionase family DNA binding protein